MWMWVPTGPSVARTRATPCWRACRSPSDQHPGATPGPRLMAGFFVVASAPRGRCSPPEGFTGYTPLTSNATGFWRVVGSAPAVPDPGLALYLPGAWFGRMAAVAGDRAGPDGHDGHDEITDIVAQGRGRDGGSRLPAAGGGRGLR